MTPVDTRTVDPTAIHVDDHSILERSGNELILYRLCCAQTANGLSHYYMYGDIAPDETLL
ncbi:MAG: hypothetical protein M1343_06795 [Chloroflexi bacterium]|nr:hypothetical protein [Chloroflexota bacterium]